MSRGQRTAVITALAIGAFAPRLAAQDTSTGGQARPDTSGYNGTAGVDTSAQPGRVGAMDTTGAAGPTGAGTMAAPGRVDLDSTGPLFSDSAGAADSVGVSQPTKQPGQGTSRTGDSASSSSP
jgi:hypothetical protein